MTRRTLFGMIAACFAPKPKIAPAVYYISTDGLYEFGFTGFKAISEHIPKVHYKIEYDWDATVTIPYAHLPWEACDGSEKISRSLIHG